LKFSIQELGEGVVSRTTSFIKKFVEGEDRAQLTALKAFVATWPSSVSAILFKSPGGLSADLAKLPGSVCFDRNIYDSSFGVHAIKRMLDMNIAPSRVLCSANQGQELEARHSGRRLVYDRINNLVVVIDKKLGKILNVGRYNDGNLGALDEQATEREERIFRQSGKEQLQTWSVSDSYSAAYGNLDSEYFNKWGNRFITPNHNWHKVVVDVERQYILFETIRGLAMRAVREGTVVPMNGPNSENCTKKILRYQDPSRNIDVEIEVQYYTYNGLVRVQDVRVL
jgi:hypothetical protein